MSTGTAGRYLVSCLIEEEIGSLPVVNAMAGMDVGLTNVAMLSASEKIANPQHLRRSKRCLAHAQRELARTQRGPRIERQHV
jgi:putative transposase